MPTVLIVEDEVVTRSLISSLFIDQGATVDETPDGEAAIARLKRGDIDLVILDILMPRRDGFEVLRWLTKNHPGIPVVAISGIDTGSRGDSYADLAIGLGARKAFRKPIKPAHVAEALSLVSEPTP